MSGARTFTLQYSHALLCISSCTYRHLRPYLVVSCLHAPCFAWLGFAWQPLHLDLPQTALRLCWYNSAYVTMSSWCANFSPSALNESQCGASVRKVVISLTCFLSFAPHWPLRHNPPTYRPLSHSGLKHSLSFIYFIYFIYHPIFRCFITYMTRMCWICNTAHAGDASHSHPSSSSHSITQPHSFLTYAGMCHCAGV